MGGEERQPLIATREVQGLNPLQGWVNLSDLGPQLGKTNGLHARPETKKAAVSTLIRRSVCLLAQ